MDASNTASGKNRDPGALCQVQRCRHRGAAGLTGGQRERQVTQAALAGAARLVRQPFKLTSTQSRSGPGRRAAAMVAGVAPASRIACSACLAVSRFAGAGMPWVMIVDSSATTGKPLCSASRTAGVNSKSA